MTNHPAGNYVYIPMWSGRTYCDPKIGPIFESPDHAFAYFGFPRDEYVHATEIVKFGTLKLWRGYQRECWVRTDDERNYWILQREIIEQEDQS